MNVSSTYLYCEKDREAVSRWLDAESLGGLEMHADKIEWDGQIVDGRIPSVDEFKAAVERLSPALCCAIVFTLNTSSGIEELRAGPADR